MARTKGSRNPERLRSERLDQVLEMLSVLSPAELLAVRDGSASHLAAHSDYAENGPLRRQRRRMKMLADIEYADLAKRQKTGTGVRTLAEYDRWKPAGALSRSTLLRTFGGWPQARKEAGITSDRAPRLGVVRRDGRAAARDVPWSDAEIVAALACALEMCHGFEPSVDTYEMMRGDRPGWPSWWAITRPDLPTPRSKDGWFDRVREHILASSPDDYPFAYRRLSALKEAERG